LRQVQRRRAGTAETHGGGCWELCSGELAARAGQQASVVAIGVLVGVGAVRVGGASDQRVEFTVRLHRRGGGSAVARLLRARGHGGWVFMAWRVGEGGSRGSTPYKVAVWVRMGGEARRPIANQGRRCARTAATPLGGRRSGREHVAHRERVGMAVRRGRPHDARTGGW
jgi:hypothetical protein